jgi:hypothetical protein
MTEKEYTMDLALKELDKAINMEAYFAANIIWRLIEDENTKT